MIKHGKHLYSLCLAIFLFLLLHGVLLYARTTRITYAQAAALYSDDFNRCTLAANPATWHWINPRNDAAVQLNGEQAVITVPANRPHNVRRDGNFAPRLMQSVIDDDFDLVAKFDSTLNARFQLQGIVVEQDADNYLRFDFYHNGATLKLSAVSIAGGVATPLYDTPLPGNIVAGPAGSPLYLRVVRNGDQWSQSYSTDGVNWHDGASFAYLLVVSAVGPFIGNAGNNPPAFTGVIDYFFNRLTPILPEDGATIGPIMHIVGTGTANRLPEQATYPCGQIVTLTAAPAVGWRFAGWGGTRIGMQNPVTLSVDAGQVMTATFVKESYLLNLSTIGQGQLAVWPPMIAYPYNTVVTLTATPKADWRFVGWEGDLMGSANPAQVTIDRAKAIIALFSTMTPTLSYTLTASVIGEGVLDRSPLGPTYRNGTVVTLTATPTIGWQFAGWEGLATSNNPATVVMTQTRVITATFVPVHVVTVSVVGSGTVIRSPDIEGYRHGSTVTLTATAAPDWRFAGWQDDATGSQSPLLLTVDRDLRVTANFIKEQLPIYPLAVTADTGGTVSVSPRLESYPTGTAVTVTAVPTTGWTFQGWQGDVTGTTNPLIITMDHAYSVRATFARRRVNFTTAVEGGGVISSSIPSGSYPYGTVVTLTANPAPDNLFVGWAGDLQGTDSTTTLLLDGDKAVTARFAPVQHGLVVQIEGNGTVVADSAPPYSHNQVVQLTATPRRGWLFTGWSGDMQGEANPLSLVMDSDKTIVAKFAIEVLGMNSHLLYLPYVAR